jgi:hypothetical protein
LTTLNEREGGLSSGWQPWKATCSAERSRMLDVVQFRQAVSLDFCSVVGLSGLWPMSAGNDAVHCHIRGKETGPSGASPTLKEPAPCSRLSLGQSWSRFSHQSCRLHSTGDLRMRRQRRPQLRTIPSTVKLNLPTYNARSPTGTAPPTMARSRFPAPYAILHLGLRFISVGLCIGTLASASYATSRGGYGTGMIGAFIAVTMPRPCPAIAIARAHIHAVGHLRHAG